MTDSTTTSINAITASEPIRHTWSISQSSDPNTETIYRHLTRGLPKPTERDMQGTSLRAHLLLHQWPYLIVQNDIMFLRDPSSHHLRPVVPGCLIEPVLNDLHTQLAHFSKLKPYRGRLPVCTADSLPILPAGQVLPVAIEVTIPYTSDPPSTEDSAAP
ncbi:unnamed protein product [Schistocephalus solidus]|uniref:DUF5753 domain-containing protein n=1 Tax=Schistocephalus solidus TaxID=70667 RepID=A0A183SB53_SCHSO|nr:unnamed protein product [Schistocephalus solidus]